jgi:nicotinamidase-related amidase
MLKAKNTAMVLVDVQEKLLPAMHNDPAVLTALEKLLRGLAVLDVPVIWCEQLPEKLGPTDPSLATLLEGNQPIAKSTFRCTGSKKFIKTLDQISPKQLLVAGIEAHVCVYQTAVDLAEMGFGVQVVADAVTSRTAENRQIALDRMGQEEVKLTSVEMALMELLRDADDDRFKQILPIIK